MEVITLLLFPEAMEAPAAGPQGRRAAVPAAVQAVAEVLLLPAVRLEVEQIPGQTGPTNQVAGVPTAMHQLTEAKQMEVLRMAAALEKQIVQGMPMAAAAEAARDITAAVEVAILLLLMPEEEEAAAALPILRVPVPAPRPEAAQVQGIMVIAIMQIMPVRAAAVGAWKHREAAATWAAL